MGFEYGVDSLSSGNCPPFLGGHVSGEKDGEVGLSLVSMGMEGGHLIMSSSSLSLSSSSSPSTL